jgi:hypothetical protein
VSKKKRSDALQSLYQILGAKEARRFKDGKTEDGST